MRAKPAPPAWVASKRDRSASERSVPGERAERARVVRARGVGMGGSIAAPPLGHDEVTRGRLDGIGLGDRTDEPRPRAGPGDDVVDGRAPRAAWRFQEEARGTRHAYDR